MVLKAQIGGYDIGRVFIDTGSGINLIYARTLKADLLLLIHRAKSSSHPVINQLVDSL
jgi:hypothetical protein